MAKTPAPPTAPAPTIRPSDVDLLLSTTHWDPFSVLGPHVVTVGRKKAVAIRTLVPYADRAFVVVDEEGLKRRTEMVKVHDDGIFEAVFPHTPTIFPYHFEFATGDGHRWTQDDAYRFGVVLGELDVHLIGEGNHLRAYEKLGAHLADWGGVKGVTFAVWAPNAERVSVVGDFNHWDGRVHPMRNRGESGLWEIFVPGLCEGEVYKFEIRNRATGDVFTKTDPHGFRFELPPRTGSIVCELAGHEWKDAAWMASRAQGDPLQKPMSVYEVHLGSWRRKEGNRYLTYAELADELVPYVKDLGYTHIELLPVTEYPFDGSWGYQTLGYFAPTSRFGHPKEFMAFVDRCHAEGIGIILDWVPAHFPKDAHGLAWFDGTPLYEHADPRKGEHRDWGTLIFNYGRREVSNFLYSNALFWLEKFHLDGLRVDAVASMLYLDYSRPAGEWEPNAHGGRENLEAIAFLKRMNELVHQHHPGAVTIAEESTSWPMVSRPTYLGGLGFTLKWNMGWMHDMLAFIEQDPVFRRYHVGQLTFSLLYAFHENFVLPFSHDEVVHLKRSLLDKMPGDVWRKFANLRLLYAYMYAHPGRKLLFMGCEIGQWEEWDHDRGLPWEVLFFDNHRGVHSLVRDLNGLYKSVPALHEVDDRHEGFEWIDFRDLDQTVVSFLRRGKDPNDVVVCVFNFTPVVRACYRVGVPFGGFWAEALNTDGEKYAGSNAGNHGGVTADDIPCNGRPHSVSLTLPPLGALYLRLPM